MNKDYLRKFVIKNRKELDISKISDFFVEKILSNEVYKNSKNILLFYPMKYEINLLQLLEDSSKNFYLPKISGNELLCCPYKKGDFTSESSFKTQEPLSEACNKNIIDLIIVPALACDKFGCRLGYGGGFYDRFLKDCNAYKICCVPKQFYFDNINAETHDVKVNLVLTY